MLIQSRGQLRQLGALAGLAVVTAALSGLWAGLAPRQWLVFGLGSSLVLWVNRVELVLVVGVGFVLLASAA